MVTVRFSAAKTRAPGGPQQPTEGRRRRARKRRDSGPAHAYKPSVLLRKQLGVKGEVRGAQWGWMGAHALAGERVSCRATALSS